MATIGEITHEIEASLSEAGVENARSEVRLLFSHVLGLTTAQVFNRTQEEIDESHRDSVVRLADERARGVPMAHLIGRREFWSLLFDVNASTLVPRPESETLIELALEIFSEREAPEWILDLGTGSGCLVLALLSEFTDAQAWATDVSPDALTVATRNAGKLGLQERVKFKETNWSDGIEKTFDLIVSNPPYIATHEILNLEATVRDFEPQLALDGGTDGLDAYRTIFALSPKLLAAGGVLLFEIGIGQERALIRLSEERGFRHLETRTDLANIPRAMAFDKKSVGIE